MSGNTMYLLVILRFASISHANEDQLNNEYYDRNQCISQEIADINERFRDCTEHSTELDCASTDEEIKNMIIVSCGEDNKNVQKTVQSTNNLTE